MDNKAIFYLAHGAGAGSKSDFIQAMVELVSHPKIEVRTFDFPYMQRRNETGKKSPPDRMPKLIECFIEQVSSKGKQKVFIGGKSMGGRVASMIADELDVSGVICLGYPFHPPGKLEKLRTEHLQELKSRCLILQGTRDPFGKPAEVATYALSSKIDIQWVDDGDHSFKTLKRSKLTSEQTLVKVASSIQDFILSAL